MYIYQKNIYYFSQWLRFFIILFTFLLINFNTVYSSDKDKPVKPLENILIDIIKQDDFSNERKRITITYYSEDDYAYFTLIGFKKKQTRLGYEKIINLTNIIDEIIDNPKLLHNRNCNDCTTFDITIRSRKKLINFNIEEDEFPKLFKEIQMLTGIKP